MGKQRRNQRAKTSAGSPGRVGEEKKRTLLVLLWPSYIDRLRREPEKSLGHFFSRAQGHSQEWPFPTLLRKSKKVAALLHFAKIHRQQLLVTLLETRIETQ